MLLPISQVFLARDPVDMRCGHDGLYDRVRRLGFDVFKGGAFVFFNRRRNRVKILLWTKGGLTLLYKRLEKEKFFAGVFEAQQQTASLTSTQLAVLLEGGNPFVIEQKVNSQTPANWPLRAALLSKPLFKPLTA